MICFPQSNADSVAFYTGLRRPAQYSLQAIANACGRYEDLVTRTVVLFTHRHSLETLKEVLPPRLRIAETATLRRAPKGAAIADKLAGDSPWGLCDVAVFERVP